MEWSSALQAENQVRSLLTFSTRSRIKLKRGVDMEKLTEQELQQITGGVPSFITKGKEIINNPKNFWDNIKDSKFLEIGLKFIWRN